MNEVIVMVTGSRKITDEKFVFESLAKSLKKPYFNQAKKIKFIHGTAGGVDHLTERFAKEHSYSSQTYEPNWQYYKRGAGYKNNEKMVEICHKGISIWDGESKGTLHATKQLIKSNKLQAIFFQSDLETLMNTIKEDPILKTYFIKNYLINIKGLLINNGGF